jgi:mono/diheme cytochrome c family protein
MLRTLALLASTAAFAAPVDFAREVRPILSDACFHCHGPDEAKREAKLRLDTPEGLYRTLDGVTVVTPGRPEASELILRVLSQDRDEVMPPRKAVRQLQPAEIETLRRWVAEGAPYGQHWAFAPMQPYDAQASIDTFLPAHGPEASPARLARRLAFDLTGLPPTLEQIDRLATASGESHKAQAEKLIDELLASPRFGEHLAADWMDVARFADTHGYQMDAPRPMWPWRDWVIDAFNRNLPFDQFVTWQLAGDLLPGATQEQKLATAFNRLHMQNEEGGIVEEEFRVAYVVDRVNTFATAFLGLTMECARCHDHKYDPLTQRDFFSLFAFFQNIDEAGQNPYTGFVNDMPEPTLLLSTPEQQAKLTTLAQQIAAKEAEWPALVATAPRGASDPAPALLAGEVLRCEFESLDKQAPAKPHESPVLIEGKTGRAALLDGENGFTFPGLGNFHRAQEFSLSLWLRPARHVPRAVVVHHTRAPVDAGSRGYELLLENGRAVFSLNHLWPGNALRVITRQPLAENAWTHLTATYDGSSRASGVQIFINGQRAALEIVRDGLTKDITPGNGELTIGHRFRDTGFKGGAVDDFRVFNRALTAREAAQLAGHEEDSETARFEHFLATAYEPARKWRTELAALRDAQRKYIQPIPEIMVMRELPQPKRAFILQRGAYDAPGLEVTADTPAVLPPFPQDAPRNRLGLARWLLDPEHPLMARVTVNRLWQMMFGTGLVETAENFGTQGAPPANQALLDWLARDFVAHGWNVKRTLKQIALSAAYRAANRPARRLSAEMLRDQALAVSGLLVEKIGGPSVKPYQPPGLWEEIAMGKPRYEQDKGEALHRRSLYTFWKRTVPPPAMMTFDAADRSNCSVRRQSTSTPLQALALLNDVQIVEAARHLATRMLHQSGTPAEQVAWAFRTVTSRLSTDKETAILVRLFEEQRDFFAQDAAAATKLLAFGETPADPKLPAADLAAGTVLALAVLNHDEAVMRR